ALEAPKQRHDEAFESPSTLVEQTLERLWSEVLRLERVGVTADFFTELGGHSLLATQLISRVRDTFGIEIPLRSIFEAPTVRQLAFHIERISLDQEAPIGPTSLEAPTEPPSEG